MNSYIIRTYPDACFLFNKENSDALFLEGSLANLVPQVLDKSIQKVPSTVLESLDREERKYAEEDFLEIVKAVNDFASGESKTGRADKAEYQTKSAMESFSDYAVNKWLIVNVSLELTYYCNQRCRWCYLGNFSNGGLDIQNLQEIAKQLNQIGAVFMLFTGGEIFTRPDALEILEEFGRYDFALEMKTNGLLLTPEIIQRLEKLKLFNLQVSLYDINDGWSDHTRSDYQSSRLQKNIELLQETNIPLEIAVLVGNHNIDQLDSYKKWLDDVGAKEVFYNPYITPNRNGGGDELLYRLSYRELEEKFLPFLKKVNGLFSPRKYRDASCKDQPACYAGRDQIAINPQGIVYPCLDLRLPLGNLRREKIQEILEKRENVLKPFKLKNIPQCASCDIVDYCDSCVGTALLENGDFKVPSQHKCDISRFYYANRREVIK